MRMPSSNPWSIIAKKRQIKQGAMQELLTGKKRLPGFATKPGYTQTEVGMIPEDWELRELEKFQQREPVHFPTMEEDNSSNWNTYHNGSASICPGVKVLPRWFTLTR